MVVTNVSTSNLSKSASRPRELRDKTLKQSKDEIRTIESNGEKGELGSGKRQRTSLNWDGVEEIELFAEALKGVEVEIAHFGDFDIECVKT